MFRNILIGTFIVTAILLLLIGFIHLQELYKGELDPEEQHIFLEYYRTIGLGFLIAILGVMIPHLLANEKYRNQRFQDSKIHYSEAKTDIIYLKEEISQLYYFDAIKKLKNAHRKLHLAETHPKELKQHLKWLHPYENTWVDRNYWELTFIRQMLNSKIKEWNSLTVIEKEQEVKGVLDGIENFFGQDNNEWHSEISKIYDKEIFYKKTKSNWNKAKRIIENKLLNKIEGIA